MDGGKEFNGGCLQSLRMYCENFMHTSNIFSRNDGMRFWLHSCVRDTAIQIILDAIMTDNTL
jgi:hypothetical protein